MGVTGTMIAWAGQVFGVQLDKVEQEKISDIVCVDRFRLVLSSHHQNTFVFKASLVKT